MKKSTEIKYPNSANLFQFCRRVLDHKFGGIRVIDQDVGQILGFDPADCSHWKKGKKNIRSIQAVKSIAEHLGVDEKLVVDVASGDMDDTEAFFEYSGYGAFALDSKVFEAAKKDFFRRHSGHWTKDLESAFREQFSAGEEAIDAVVQEIHQKINFQEAPLYLPEVFGAYPDLQLVAVKDDGKGTQAVTVSRRAAQTQVSYTAGTEMRPYMRYRIAKAMAAHFLKGPVARPDEAHNEFNLHLADVQGNLFAAKLLVPLGVLRREMGQVNVAKDIVAQLSDIFWVSKTFMNRRLKDILQSQSQI